MIKQRFVVWKAFNKQGEVITQLMIAGGKHTPFSGFVNLSKDAKYTTKYLMRYGKIPSTNWWKDFAKEIGACRFQKVIYFN